MSNNESLVHSTNLTYGININSVQMYWFGTLNFFIIMRTLLSKTCLYSKANFSCQVISSYGWCSVEKLAGDLLLGLKVVRLEILSTSKHKVRLYLWFCNVLYIKLTDE